MKKILTLERANEIKKNLEGHSFYSIENDNKLIEDNNSIPASEERQINIQEIESKKEMKSDLLINLYIAVTTANLKKHNKGKENSYYIKKLSELEREKSHLSKIKEIDTKKKEKRTIKEKILSFIKPKDIIRRTEEIEKDILEIKRRIAKFNKETNVSIEITNQMNEFLKSIEN